MSSSVEEKVKEIIIEQLSVDEGEVTATASFIDDLGADSLDTVELVMALEEGFNIEIPDDAAEKITTVGEAIQYIEAHGPSRNPKTGGRNWRGELLSPASGLSPLLGSEQKKRGMGSPKERAVWWRSLASTLHSTRRGSRLRFRILTHSDGSKRRRSRRWTPSSTTRSPLPTLPGNRQVWKFRRKRRNERVSSSARASAVSTSSSGAQQPASRRSPKNFTLLYPFQHHQSRRGSGIDPDGRQGSEFGPLYGLLLGCTCDW